MCPPRICYIDDNIHTYPHVDILLFFILFFAETQTNQFAAKSKQLCNPRIVFQKIQYKIYLTSKFFLRHDMLTAQIGNNDHQRCYNRKQSQDAPCAQTGEPFLSRTDDLRRHILQGI